MKLRKEIADILLMKTKKIVPLVFLNQSHYFIDQYGAIYIGFLKIMELRKLFNIIF